MRTRKIFPGLLSLLLIFAATCRVDAAPGSKRYFNDKYGYSIDYPVFLIPQGEPDAQDGQQFLSKSSPLKLSVWATYSNWQSGEEMSLREEREWDIQNLACPELPAAKLTSQRSGKNWFVLAGISGKNKFYRRTIKTKDAFVTALFIYPLVKKLELEPVALRAAQSLK